jgi:hypothetical protein
MNEDSSFGLLACIIKSFQNLKMAIIFYLKALQKCFSLLMFDAVSTKLGE